MMWLENVKQFLDPKVFDESNKIYLGDILR